MKPSSHVETLPYVVCFPTLVIPYLFPTDVSSFIVATTFSTSTKRQSQASWKHLTQNHFYIHAIANHYFASSFPNRGLDFILLCAGVFTQELRRQLAYESILLCLSLSSHVTQPSRRTTAEKAPLIAGSYALHHWMNTTEGTTPPWDPGDVDIWIPNMTGTTLIAAELRSIVFRRYGIVLVKGSQYSTLYGSGGTRQLGPRDGTCRVAHMCNLTFNLDDPYSLRSPNVNPTLSQQICKVSLIAVIGSQIFPVSHGIRTGRAWRNAVSHIDILNRFDISFCMCGFYVSREEGAHANHHVFVLTDKVKEHISSRKGDIMPYLHSNDKRRIIRIAKYRERGFEIVECP